MHGSLRRWLAAAKGLPLRRLLLLAALSGCEGRAPAPGADGGGRLDLPEFNHSSLRPRQLEGRILVAAGLSTPLALGVVGPYLVVADETGDDSLLKVYERDAGGLVFATGRMGSGPGEYQDIWAVRPARASTAHRPEAWVYDFTLRRLTFLDLGDAGRSIPARERPTLRLDSEVSITAAAWLDDTTIVSLGFFREGRVGVFDNAGRLRRTVGALPAVTKDAPPAVLQHAYQSNLGVKPDGSLVFVANRHAGRLELFRPTGERIAIVHGPFDFEPTFRVVPGRDSARTPVFSSGDDLRFGYLSIAVTETRAFVLFSGRTRRGFPGAANQGQFVHVFDWTGQLLDTFDLGRSVFALDVDPAGEVLYAIQHDPEPAVVVFDIGGAT